MLFVFLLLCDSYRCSKLILIHNRLPLGPEREYSSTSHIPPRGTWCPHLPGVHGCPHLPGVQGVHTSQGYRVSIPPRGTWVSTPPRGTGYSHLPGVQGVHTCGSHIPLTDHKHYITAMCVVLKLYTDELFIVNHGHS